MQNDFRVHERQITQWAIEQIETAGLDRPVEATQSLGRLAATGAIWITIDMVATQGISLA